MKKLALTKRQKFFIASLLAVLGIILLRTGIFNSIGWRFRAVGFGLFSSVLALLSLYDEDFSGVEWLTLLVLPVFLALSAALVFPLLPIEVPYFLVWKADTDTGLFLAAVIRGLYLIVFGVGFYASLLTANILNVAGVKVIQLVRAAHSVGFFLTLVSAMLIFTVIYSLHLSSFTNFMAVFLASFPLVIQSVWSINLETKVSREVAGHALVVSLIMSQLAWVMSFWPVPGLVFAIVLTAACYEGVGSVQYQLLGRLRSGVVRELSLVAGVFVLIIIFSSSWTG